MSQRNEYHPPPEMAVVTYIGSDRRSQTALSQLARQFNYVCTTAVDSLQVAAALESGGITDRIAREEYGLPDVFAVAEELYRSVPRRLKVAADTPFSSGRWQTLRELSHGVLFVLPALAYPAISQAIGSKGLLVGLVLSTAVGWAWGLGMSWLVYRLIGRGFQEEAARLLLRLGLIGIGLVGVGAALLSYWWGLGPQTVVFATSQMAYQMVASVLIIYRLEGWLLVVLLPSILTNAWYLAAGSPTPAQGSAVGSSLATLALGLTAACYAIWTTPRAKDFSPTLAPKDYLGGLPLLVYGALSAALVLLGNTHYMFSNLDLSLSIMPLVVSMGVLEWQVRRFRERSVLLLRETQRVREFVAGERRILLETLGAALFVVAIVSLACALILSQLEQLSIQGAMMFAAHLMLAGVFYINFILLARGRLWWVLGSFAGAVLLYLGLSLFLDPALSYGIATSLLLGVVASVLGVSLGQIAQYR